jgi:hypothetical protein
MGIYGTVVTANARFSVIKNVVCMQDQAALADSSVV